jgi:hypothetical protein
MTTITTIPRFVILVAIYLHGDTKKNIMWVGIVLITSNAPFNKMFYGQSLKWLDLIGI